MTNRGGFSRGFLARLRRNEAGNTLALVGAGIFPLLGLIGGGVDMSRIYLTKARLQQACDAGALAGRKAMGGGQWSSSSYAARQTAYNMFAANFATNAYGTSGLTREYVEATGRVTGTASVSIPMTVMRIFGQGTRTISVTCDAEMRLPNTDIMFVLDETGSMSGTKIAGLKRAVMCFYEIIAKRDTEAVCSTPDDPPSGGVGDQVQIRFGFVPYAVNVNVGNLLPTSYMADRWSYQTRVPVFRAETYIDGYKDGKPYVHAESTKSASTGKWETTNTYSGVTSSDCSSKKPVDTFTLTGSEGSAYNKTTTTSGNTQLVKWFTDQNRSGYEYNFSWERTGGSRSTIGNCTITRRTKSDVLVREYRQSNTAIYATRDVFNNWEYRQNEWDVSALKTGTLELPLGTNGVNTTISWGGCIEERQTVKTTSFSPIPTNAFDLNIDMEPDARVTTKWGPLLSGVVWQRFSNKDRKDNQRTLDTVTADNQASSVSVSCPTAARRLEEYSTDARRDNFVSYVKSLTANGNTYHDIGLLWGARLMSPTGIFSKDNAFTPKGGMIERHMIFMTDGDTVTDVSNYSAYGIHWWDRRQTSSAPSNSDTNNQVNLRFAALCEAVKNMNITLWVVNYGTDVGTDTGNRLNSCATPGRYYSAANPDTLLTTFRSIANQISQLRLTN